MPQETKFALLQQLVDAVKDWPPEDIQGLFRIAFCANQVEEGARWLSGDFEDFLFNQVLPMLESGVRPEGQCLVVPA